MRRALLTGSLLAIAAALLHAQEGADEAKRGAAKRKEEGDTGLTGALDEEAFKALHELSEKERPAPKGVMIDLGGTRAYLTLPAGEPPFPAVLVIHEWWGLNRHIQYWADRLAADGYAALAVDLYEGRVAENREDASRYMRSVDEEKARATLARAHAFLKEDPRVKATKRGCIGWCFGGGWSLQHALRTPDLDAAVVYYGRLVLDPEELKAIKAPLLGIFGSRDRGFPPGMVDEFEKALTKAGVRHRILRYDAEHAFANPSGARYDEEAASAAWAEVRTFLEANLR